MTLCVCVYAEIRSCCVTVVLLVLVLVCNVDYPCEGMSRHATFENFGMAFLTLFQVSTGDNWNGIMKVRPDVSLH